MKPLNSVLYLILLYTFFIGEIYAVEIDEKELKHDIPRICDHIGYGNWLSARRYMYSGRKLVSDTPFKQARCSGKDIMRFLVEDLSYRVTKHNWREIKKDFQNDEADPSVLSLILVVETDGADVLTRIESLVKMLKKQKMKQELNESVRNNLIKRENLLLEIRVDILKHLAKYPVLGSAKTLLKHSQ